MPISKKHEDEVMDKKSQTFRRLGEKRISNLIKHLRLIGNLANKKNYSYTDEEVNQMFTAIENELENTKKKFDHYSSEDFGEFKFK
ncbi:MAG: hypothetical protein ACE5EE_07685 [Fidelibacterota bacterium]